MTVGKIIPLRGASRSRRGPGRPPADPLTLRAGRVDELYADDLPPCSLPGKHTAMCPRWSICQRGAACETFMHWWQTGKTYLSLGRSPSSALYKRLFSDTDRTRRKNQRRDPPARRPHRRPSQGRTAALR